MKSELLGTLSVRLLGGRDGNGGGTGPVIVLLHGFGAPGDDLVSLAGALKVPSGTRFVFPEAPIDLGPMYMGGRAWWKIDLEARMRREALGQARDLAEIPDGLVEARAEVIALLNAVERELHAPPTKIVLGGFSQGAMLSLDVALRSDRAFAGVVLMSGTHIAKNEWAPLLKARAHLPLFMSHGTEDPVLPFKVSSDLRDTLVSEGWSVEWIPFRGGHGIPSNVTHGVSTFLEKVLT